MWEFLLLHQATRALGLKPHPSHDKLLWAPSAEGSRLLKTPGAWAQGEVVDVPQLNAGYPKGCPRCFYGPRVTQESP